MTVAENDQPRTLLALLVIVGDKSHEEHVAGFNEQARRMGESATLSLRQFERWLAGELVTLPRHTARRVAAAQWGHPIDALLAPPSPMAISQGSVVVVSDDDDRPDEDDVKRRALLGGVVATAGIGLTEPALRTLEQARRSMDVVLDASNVSPVTIARWERTADEYAHSYQTLPPGQLLSDVLADLTEVQSLLNQRQPVRFRQRLCDVAAQMAVLAGVFLSAMGHQREARGWFHTARLAADEAADRRLAGTAIARAATVSFYYGAPASALEQAREAKAVLGTNFSASRVRALVVEARALARLGHSPATVQELLDEAATVFNRLSTDEVNNTALGFTERQLWFTMGTAYTSLGLVTRADELQQKALRMYQPTEYLDPALIRLDQARCLLSSDEPEAACELALMAITSAPDKHRPGLVTHSGRTLVHELPRQVRHLSAARQLREVLALPM